MLDSVLVESAWFYVALFFVAAVTPLFWTLAISLCLYAGQRVLSDRVGHALFGPYWLKGQRQRARLLKRRGYSGARRGVRDLR